MSILDGLDIYYPAGVEMEGEAFPESEWYRRDDVREALTNPTDEQVEAIAERARRLLGTWVTGYEVRAVLAAAAGGER